MAEILHLQVAAQDPFVKLSWITVDSASGIVTPFGVYTVPQTVLRKAAQKVRAVLKDIADEYRTSNGSYDSLFAPLCAAGESLRYAVFPAQDDTAQNVLTYVASHTAWTSLNVITDATVQVPWGFLFLGDAMRTPDVTGTLADFADFWCLKFRIRIRYSLLDAPPLGRSISRQKVKTLAALHEARFSDAKDVLSTYVVQSGKVKSLLEKMDQLLERPVGWTMDWHDCREKWKQMANSDSVFYILAHSDGKTLSLKDELDKTDRPKYELDVGDFASHFIKGKEDVSQTLCFINGCRTADGEWDDGFVSATSTHGFQGFIGSEAEISSVWATRYAVEFLYRLIEEGKSVDEAFEELREVCFPMSLWYSCYAYPHFRIAAE